MTVIVDAHSSEQVAEARRLIEEYAALLGIDLSFQGFERELASLPGDYARPRGRLLLAMLRGETVGCVAVRDLGEGACEMKRLYVRPGFRRRGIGRQLAESAIDEARGIGYARMRLDTLASMAAARALYALLGFTEIAPYRHNPHEGAVFLELELSGEQ